MQRRPPDPVPLPVNTLPNPSGGSDVHPFTLAAMIHVVETNPYGETRQGLRQWMRELKDQALAELKRRSAHG